MSEEEQSDQFNGRLGLIFASIGAAIGTGNIWRFHEWWVRTAVERSSFLG